jgi:hypothetical protein
MLTTATYEHVARGSMEAAPTSGYNTNYLKTKNKTHVPYAKAGQLQPNWSQEPNMYRYAVPVAQDSMEPTTNLDFNKNYLKTANRNITPAPEPWTKVKALAMLTSDGEASLPEPATKDPVKILKGLLAQARPDKQNEIRKLITKAEADPNPLFDAEVEKYLSEVSNADLLKAMNVNNALMEEGVVADPDKESSLDYESDVSDVESVKSEPKSVKSEPESDSESNFKTPKKPEIQDDEKAIDKTMKEFLKHSGSNNTHPRISKNGIKYVADLLEKNYPKVEQPDIASMNKDEIIETLFELYPKDMLELNSDPKKKKTRTEIKTLLTTQKGQGRKKPPKSKRKHAKPRKSRLKL